MTIQANQGFGVSIFGATSAGGGGSTSPGGSSGQLQYNASGSFAGMAGTSWDDTNRSLTLTGATVTTSQPVLNLSQTWNAGAVTFTGLKFNATDTASAAASLLLDLQVGGASKFNLRKDGAAFFVGRAFMGNSTDSYIGGDTSQIYFGSVGASAVGFSVQSYVATALAGGASFGWTSNSTNATAGLDTILRRAAAATLQLGAADAAAPVAQTLQVQSVVAGTTNTAGANFTIKGSAGTGTGAGGSIIFQVAPAGSSGTAQNAYSTALTITGDRRLVLANYGSSIDPVIVGYDSGGVQSGFYFPNSGVDLAWTRADSATWGVGFQRCSVVAGAHFSWGSSTNPLGTEDLVLERDAANTLALRNGANAQTFNIYNTYTDASNYERGFFRWSSNILEIGNEKAGTGTPRITRLTSATTSGTAWEMRSTGQAAPTLVLAGTDRSVSLTAQDGMLSIAGGTLSQLTYAAGGSARHTLRSVNDNATSAYFALNGVAAGIMQIGNGSGKGDGYGAAVEMWEMTAPAAPAANGVRIYAEDNGSGKTRLMALFATGAAQQIAIEP